MQTATHPRSGFDLRPDPHLAAAAHPDPHALRRMIARDLAALDPFHRRRYYARLERLIKAAQDRREAAEAARAARSAGAVLTAVAAFAASAALVAAALAVDAAPLIRLALAATALCGAMVVADALTRRASVGRREDRDAPPEAAALDLHLQAFAALRYAADLPSAPERGRERPGQSAVSSGVS